jgi:hypothetical protein
MTSEGNYVLRNQQGQYAYIDQSSGGYPALTRDFGGAQRWLTAQAANEYVGADNTYGLAVHKIVEVITKPVVVRTEMIPHTVFEDPVTQ